MMEKETMATEKMVPFTMGTLDTKSIGELSATGRAGLGEQCTPLRKEPVAK